MCSKSLPSRTRSDFRKQPLFVWIQGACEDNLFPFLSFCSICHFGCFVYPFGVRGQSTGPGRKDPLTRGTLHSVHIGRSHTQARDQGFICEIRDQCRTYAPSRTINPVGKLEKTPTFQRQVAAYGTFGPCELSVCCLWTPGLYITGRELA